MNMVRMEDRIILAIECGYCRQITGMKVYNTALFIDRCGACGQDFPAVDNLAHQYESYANRIEGHQRLRRMLEEALEAMKVALEQWGQEAGKEALARVLHNEAVADAETGDV